MPYSYDVLFLLLDCLGKLQSCTPVCGVVTGKCYLMLEIKLNEVFVTCQHDYTWKEFDII